ncbi:MAG: hypothetical protein LUE12_00265 [Ruminococcus sp.]|nr:hypothetical protein [Ruminococcus sp.]
MLLLRCIKLDVATDAVCGTGSLSVEHSVDMYLDFFEENGSGYERYSEEIHEIFI